MSRYETQIRKWKDVILNGNWIAVDPATISVGYQLVSGGVLGERGRVEVTNPADHVSRRLHELLVCLWQDFPDVELLVIERIGKSRTTRVELIESVGVFRAVWGVPTIKIAPTTWRKFAGQEYCAWKAAATKAGVPTDDEDARVLAQTVLAVARRFNGKTQR